MKVLFVGSNPPNTAALAIGEELRGIKDALRASARSKFFEFHEVLDATTDSLQAALAQHKPEVVHFSGHAEKSGILLPASPGDAGFPVPISALATLFQGITPRVRCVLLNACDTLPSATSLAGAVDCAIGTPVPIIDTSAARFAASFYRELAFGNNIEAAVRSATNGVHLTGFTGFPLPTIVCQPGRKPAQIVLHTTLLTSFLYENADREALDSLQKFLKPLARNQVLKWVDERDLSLDADPAEAREKIRASAQLIVVLISPDFLSSDELYAQLEQALARQKNGEARLVPILVQPALLDHTPLQGLSVLPLGGKALSELPNRASALATIANDLERIAKNLRERILSQMNS